ncbi:hypothetical protein FKM82_028114, partial [Ascaphus truei]
ERERERESQRHRERVRERERESETETVSLLVSAISLSSSLSPSLLPGITLSSLSLSPVSPPSYLSPLHDPSLSSSSFSCLFPRCLFCPPLSLSWIFLASLLRFFLRNPSLSALGCCSENCTEEQRHVWEAGTPRRTLTTCRLSALTEGT